MQLTGPVGVQRRSHFTAAGVLVTADVSVAFALAVLRRLAAAWLTAHHAVRYNVEPVVSEAGAMTCLDGEAPPGGARGWHELV